MADEDEAAAIVVVFQIVVEGVGHVAVVALVVVGEIAGVHQQAGNRNLSVNRREQPAHRLEAGQLGENGDDLLVAARMQVGIGVLVHRSRGIDIEAVDRRLGAAPPSLKLHRTIGADDAGAEIVVANINLVVGMAQPVVDIAVVDRGKARIATRIRLRPSRRHRQNRKRRQAKNHSPNTIPHVACSRVVLFKFSSRPPRPDSASRWQT